MKLRYVVQLITCTILISNHWSGAAEPVTRPPRQSVEVVESRSGIVVSETDEASAAACKILTQGGNAVDAAVTTAFVLAVTWPEAGNLGGGGFMMIAPPGDDVVCVDYRETAPASVSANSFVNWTDRHHARMAGVPGTVAGLATAHERYGTLPWKQLVIPAVQLARDGVEVDEFLAWSLNSYLTRARVRTDPQFAEFRRVYGHPDGRHWRVGDRLVQPDLASTLELIAEQGASAFYEGAIASRLLQEMKRSEGLISREDLKSYEALIKPAVSGRFRGYTIYGAPPPSSGGLTVILEMQMVETLKLTPTSEEFWTADQVHLLSEVMRRAFRERAAHLGDLPMTRELHNKFSRARAHELASTIDRETATSSKSIADKIAITEGPYESPQTTHFSVIDANGMAVSNTYTLEESYGSRIVVAGAGFLLNNEMGDFNWYPGYTNTEGTIGTEPNEMAPGKRMLSSQSPTIVKQGEKVRLVTGSPGGRTIINTVYEILVQTLAFERPLPEAVDGWRFHHQWYPDVIRLESLDEADVKHIAEELESRGHNVRLSADYRQGSAHSISVDVETDMATGVADWRRGGAARRAETVQTVP
ncbi:gamma-glutamyltransferase [Rubinisphaera margarita]|uniref:gamma-glutamyltransferase n=1 Tax=Rubinisphaera margarita TaxID=2909586 RepID=UPI001EE8A489|nr:gamma-glutamyltransferase [Rubinisphaera margarita]MCG6156483.1 gamma-glutamyltransferase [Rubinisphaera margarita]